MKSLFGSELSPAVQREAKARFVHRFTGENKPAWARGIWKDGLPYPLQFKDDADWLANTTFEVNCDGSLCNRVDSCHSRPTWPNNPELRYPESFKVAA